jgi:hypothetical protein
MKYIFVILFAISVILLNAGNHESFLGSTAPFRDDEDTILFHGINKFVPEQKVIEYDELTDSTIEYSVPAHLDSYR